MVHILLIVFISLSLCACEERVSIRAYENLQYSMYIAEGEYNELILKYQKLKEDQEELEDELIDVEYEYKDLKKRVKYAKEKVEILIDEYNKFVNGHWALKESDIANDADDVKSALEGHIVYRVRTRNGIRY